MYICTNTTKPSETKTCFRHLLHHLARTQIGPILQLDGPTWGPFPTYVYTTGSRYVAARRCEQSFSVVTMFQVTCLSWLPIHQ